MWGSGLRAAAAVSTLAGSVRLITAIDEGSMAIARIVATAHGVNMETVARDEPVSFSYFTPLSSPNIGGRTARLAGPIKAADDVALVFGMVETGEIAIEANTLVFDPQRPRALAGLALAGLKWNRLALILNRIEAAALTGGQAPREAARTIAERHGAEVVVVKCAAQGAVVFSGGGIEVVGAYMTPRVYPVGSGDVFAAGFTWAWAVQGMPAVRAAQVGSLAAATWCATERLPLEAQVGDLTTQFTEIKPRQVQVYLAAPFFTLGEQWVVELCRGNMIAMGVEVFSPLHDVGTDGGQIAAKDLEGLERSNALMAVLDGADPGTWFEVGWARHAGKPVVGYCDPRNDQDLKMALGTDVEVIRDLSSAVYRAIWAGQQ
jgi:hypothetical protein